LRASPSSVRDSIWNGNGGSN